MEARQINCLAGSVFRGKENAFQLRCWIRAVCDYRFLGTILLLYSLPSVLEISQSSLSAPFASGWMLPNLHFHQESGLHRLGFYRGHRFQLPPRLGAARGLGVGHLTRCSLELPVGRCSCLTVTLLVLAFADFLYFLGI